MPYSTQYAKGVADAEIPSASNRKKSREFSDAMSHLRARAHVLIYLESALLAFLLAAIAGALPLVMLLRG